MFPVKSFAELLGILEPFCQMMVDLLNMFERAAVQCSDENLQIQFDFGSSFAPLHVDLTHFRQTISIVEQTIIPTYIYKIHNIWEMLGLFQDETISRIVPSALKTDEIVRWVSEYDQDFWPDNTPTQPKTGIASLDKK